MLSWGACRIFLHTLDISSRHNFGTKTLPRVSAVTRPKNDQGSKEKVFHLLKIRKI